MPQLLLADDQKLKAACAVSLEKAARAGDLERWSGDIAASIKKFRAASGEERASLEFQPWLLGCATSRTGTEMRIPARCQGLYQLPIAA